MDAHSDDLSPVSETYPGWKKKAALFLTSQNISLFGSMLVQYAIIWYVTLSTRSGWAMTFITVAAFLPQIFISLFAGVWADRYPRKLLIIASDVLIAASTLVLAVFFLMGYQELWLIYLVTAVRSTGAGIQGPAVNALVPQIVPPERLMKVNSINSTLNPLIMIAAPVISGAMLSLARLEHIFFVDVVTAALAVGLLLILKVPAHAKAAAAQTTGYLDDLKAGLAYLRQNRTIKTLFTFFGFVHFLIVPVAFLTPLLVARSYGEEVWRLTANEVTFFAGSILGGIVMTAWGGFKNRFRTIGMSCIVWAFLFSGLGLVRDFNLYLVLMFFSGMPMPFMSAATTTLLQEVVRQDMQGRVFGVQMLIMTIIMPFGMLIFGPLADVVSVELLLVVTSSLMAIPGLWLFMSKKPVNVEIPMPASDFELQAGD